MVLFNVTAIVGMRWIALAAAAGPPSLFMWVLAALVFFVPQGLAVVTLSSAIPEEGGLYVWITRALGPRHGFVAAWLYWASNILYLPTLTMSTAVGALYILPHGAPALESSPTYAGGVSLGLLVLALGMSVIGLRVARWLQNIGGIATWVPALALAALAALALRRAGPATPLWPLLPSLHNRNTVIFFSQMCFGFAGLELAPVLAGEVVDPQRTIPRAIILSALSITAVYLIGTLALLCALPAAQISVIAGVNQAIGAAGAAHGVPWLGPAMALLMTVAGLGTVGAWLNGSARLLFVGGMEGRLPAALARTHGRWGTPYVALLLQAGLSAALILVATTGSSVKSAYLVMVDATLIVTFVPYAYMFVSALLLRERIRRTPGAFAIPGGRPGSLLCNGLGLLTTLTAIWLALIPPADTPDPRAFFLKVFLGSFGFVAAGFILFQSGQRRAEPSPPLSVC